MQSKFSTEIIVGLFVLVAFLIFAGMGFGIGAFRLDTFKYNEYTIIFNQVTGLSKKAEVKISGVKVGWVEAVELNKDFVLTKIRIKNSYPLYENSAAAIRQDGWFGPKYIEIAQGSDLLPTLISGDTLKEKGKAHQDVDRLLQSLTGIGTSVEEVAESFKEALATPEGKEALKEVIQNVHLASGNLAQLTNVVNEAVKKNEPQLDAFLGMGETFKQLSTNLENNIFPSFQENVNKIATVFDRDFNRIASRFDLVGGAFETVAKQFSSGAGNLDEIAAKINRGQGLLGKIVNEDVIYQDLRTAVEGFKNYINRLDRLQLVFDSHFESMRIPAENYHYQDSKGYFELRLYPQEHYFYMLQVAYSERGFIDRVEYQRDFVDQETLDPINLATAPPRIFEKTHDWYRERQIVFKRNAIKVGLQFGTVFKRLAIRFGVFDGMGGVGFDVTIGSPQSKLYWIMSLEAFDLAGFNRVHDKRPHLKWYNRIYMPGTSVYFMLGADDFASRKNKNIFFGGGVCWGDEDIKYLLGNLSGVSSLSGSAA